jgi:DNA-binding transcriptional regulator PaaX
LQKFEKHGLLKKSDSSKRQGYNLTELAKQLGNSPSIKIHRKDGLATVILFDIPEDKHKARDRFRRYLLRNGYTQIQKSVFISPFEIFEELRQFINEMDIKRNVTFISGRIDRTN